MELLVDPAIPGQIDEIVEFWATQEGGEQLVPRLIDALYATLRLIAEAPERGRPIPPLPPQYRRLRLARSLPAYNYYYRINQQEQTVVVFLLRHEHQRPYAPATLENKAAATRRYFRERS